MGNAVKSKLSDIEKLRYSFVKKHLRRASIKWPPASEAMKAAKIERGFYRCNHCNQAFGPKQIQRDHIIPVVSIRDGFKSWDELIKNLLPDSAGYQVLCKPCHEIKTNLENDMRKKFKKQLTKKKKKV